MNNQKSITLVLIVFVFIIKASVTLFHEGDLDNTTTLFEVVDADLTAHVAENVVAYGYDPVTALAPVLGLPSKYAEMPDRRDAVRMYFGLGQVNSTFAPADYQPAEDNPVFHTEGRQLLRLAHPENLAHVERDAQALLARYERGEVELGATYRTSDAMANGDALLRVNGADTQRVGVMSNYTLYLTKDSEGQVYVSYNDVWDLGGSALGAWSDVLANTFGVYGRVY